MKRSNAEPAARKRRQPEEARAEILAAAQRLLAKHGPDAVGLKEVAAEAGVSHALVSHYFGTYEALVEAALAKHVEALRADLLERIAEDKGGPDSWIDHLFESLGHPLYGRLVAWAVLSGRLESPDSFPRRDLGMKRVADAIEQRFASQAAPLSRDDLEFAQVVTMAVAFGYHLGAGVLWGSLSRTRSKERDLAFRRRFTRMLLEHMLHDR